MKRLTEIIERLMNMSRFRLLLISIAVSEILTCLIDSAISIIIHGRITRDYVITGPITALVVSLIVTYMVLLLFDRIRKSEERFRILFESATDAIFILDAKGQFTDVNSVAYSRLGYTKDEMLSMHISQLDPPEFAARVPERLQKLMQDGQAVFESAHVRKDGTIMQVEINAKVVFLRGEKSFFSIIRDITQRKQTEEALRESERRFRAAFENAAVGASIVDLTGKFIKVNRFLCEMLGYSREELLTKTFSDVTHPDDVWIGLDYLKRQIAGELEFSSFEKRYLRKNGSVVHLIISPALIRNEKGDPQYFVGLFQDITERKKVEKRLAESEEKYRELVENANAIILKCDAQGIVTFFNEYAQRLFGFPEKEIVGNNVIGTIVPSTDSSGRDLVRMIREICVDPDRFRENENENITKDGRRVWVRWSNKAILDDQGRPTGILSVGSDITERKRIEEELRIHREQLESLVAERTTELKTAIKALQQEIVKREAMEQDLLRAQKLESLGVLAGGIAHDFNNLLASIMNHVSLAMLDLDPSQEPYRQIEGAERAALRARDLTQQLLTFSKGGAPVRKVIQIGPVIAEAAGFALRGSRVRSDLKIPRNLWPVNADEGQISQVIHNLVINADQSMPDGGVVAVRCRNVTLDEQGSLSLRPGRYVLITVSDQGSGIAEKHRDRIFDPYFTTKQKGSGLGLATTYSIVANHEGHISVASELGKGTTFSVHLPAVDEDSEVAPASEGTLVTGTGRILVMDDDEFVRTTCGGILGRLGYTPCFARDGAEAVDLYCKAREQGAPIDLVILDLTVPGGMGGKETMDQLLKIDPGIKAIVSSGYSNDPVMADYRSYGFRGIASKPYRIKDLSRAVSEAIKKE